MEKENSSDRSHAIDVDKFQARLFPFAYNIVGDSMEAEDIVQEILNKFYLGKQEHILNPFSYLVKSVVNKSINHKNSLRSRKEFYPGEWLPAPLFTEESVYTKMDRGTILNYSLMVLLEKLNPNERAVFILKETYDFSHQEIADILAINIDNSRQLLKRARHKLDASDRPPVNTKKENEQILQQLSDAIANTDVEKVKRLLSDGIKATSDGGPKVSAARNILRGKDTVYKFLKALWHKYLPASPAKFAIVNHKPAIVFFHEGSVFRCIIFEIIRNEIEDIYIVVNPDKLKSLNFEA